MATTKQKVGATGVGVTFTVFVAVLAMMGQRPAAHPMDFDADRAKLAALEERVSEVDQSVDCERCINYCRYASKGTKTRAQCYHECRAEGLCV